MAKTPLIRIENLVQHFQQGRISGKKVVHALNGIDLEIHDGETLGLVGETGCGKSTICRAIMRVYKPTGGRIFFDGEEVTHLRERKLNKLRTSMQMIFQDPAESMNPRFTVGYIIEEPLLIQTKQDGARRREKAMELLRIVSLPEESYYRYPHEFSGGQRQRIAIARALALEPKVIVCDEPVSALDVSVQSQVLNLLLELQNRQNLTLIFISHDLSVVRHMSDRVAVMYLGSLMEVATSRTIYDEPLHPYTKALIAAIPQADPEKRKKKLLSTGEVPSPIDLPRGCPFHMNCPHRIDICSRKKPELKEFSKGHFCSCHLAGKV